MKPPPRSISAHRLARLTAWAKLCVRWLAAVLPLLLACDPERARRELARGARMASDLVLLHAAQRVRHAPVKTWRPPVTRAGRMRAIRGSRLRRRLRGRASAERLFAILSVMRDLDAEAARLARRLRRGLTRRNPIPPARECVTLALPAPLSCPHAPDTS